MMQGVATTPERRTNCLKLHTRQLRLLNGHHLCSSEANGVSRDPVHQETFHVPIRTNSPEEVEEEETEGMKVGEEEEAEEEEEEDEEEAEVLNAELEVAII